MKISYQWIISKHSLLQQIQSTKCDDHVHLIIIFDQIHKSEDMWREKKTEKIEFWWLNTNKSWYGFVETRSNNTNHKRWINQCWRWFCVIDCCNLSATDVFAWLLLFPKFFFVPFSKSFRANVEKKYRTNSGRILTSLKPTLQTCESRYLIRNYVCKHC